MENPPEEKPKPPEPDQKLVQQKKSAAYSLLFELGTEFAVIFALPLIAFIYGGKWLDRKEGTHFFVIIGILLALVLSWYLVFKKINEVKKLLK